MLKQAVLFLVFFILIGPSARASEISWRISAEGGLYHFTVSQEGQRNHLLSRLNGSLRLAGAAATNNWLISFQLKPEWYRNNGDFTSIRMLSSGLYQKNAGKWIWNLGYDARKYQYELSRNSLSLESFQFYGSLIRILNSRIFLSLNPRYYYQDTSHLNQRNSDVYAGELSLVLPFSYYLRSSAGLVFEKFQIHNRFAEFMISMDRKYSGFRWGPSLFLRYQKKFLFSLRYQFLLHESVITMQSSYEHYLRIAGGVLLPGRWTALFYFDYYWNQVRFRDATVSDQLLIPYDSENRIELKIEKPLHNNWNFYTRSGYFRDILLLDNITSRGWQLTMGIEYSR